MVFVIILESKALGKNQMSLSLDDLNCSVGGYLK
jgi:hypothetical protein